MSLGVSPCSWKSSDRLALVAKWNLEWSACSNTSSTKLLFPSVSSALSINSSNIPYQIVHLVTGHSRLRSHQFRLSLSFSPSCACGEYESTRHFLFDCSLHSNARTPFKVACLQKISTWPPPLHLIPQIPSIWKLMTSFVLNSGHLSFRHISSRMTHS